ncbi:splicing factor [Coemansia javaensis]|uniref:Splicing factor n=1 Tax=Coemansia javaensis TaxID=2761396 RepID=A0A9W8HFQ8_9FUNG|nr:splicing factor [Coemansia javaensis]
MTDMARQLLQELMGELQDSGKKYTDHDVCKDHLVDFCPNQQFTNTKADLGPCSLVHDDRLREAYQRSADRGRLGYEEAFYDRLQQLTHDLQRKVRRALDRITAEADERLVNPHKEEKEERAAMLEERIKQMLGQIEELGEAAHVEEAFGLFRQMERLKGDLGALRQRIDSVNPMFKNEKRLEVCDVCGAFLVPNDASKRLDAHNEGKQHQGYIRIQRALEAFKSSGGGGGAARDVRAHGPRGDSDRHYSGSGGRRSGYARSRSRSPHRQRDRRGSSNYDAPRRRRRDDRRY